jgi:hypothetical protein
VRNGVANVKRDILQFRTEGAELDCSDIPLQTS